MPRQGRNWPPKLVQPGEAGWNLDGSIPFAYRFSEERILKMARCIHCFSIHLEDDRQEKLQVESKLCPGPFLGSALQHSTIMVSALAGCPHQSSPTAVAEG